MHPPKGGGGTRGDRVIDALVGLLIGPLIVGSMILACYVVVVLVVIGIVVWIL